MERALRVAGSALLCLLLSAWTVPAVADEPAAAEEDTGEGLVARLGSVTAFFRLFGDTGAHYDSTARGADESRAEFLAGSLDFFSTARMGDHFQTLAEVVAEFDDDTNEVGFELERLWGKWSANDAFYIKVGREHAPLSRWNRRFHHGRIFWPAVSQPFVARFEDQGGPLPIHASGVELGGTFHTGAGELDDILDFSKIEAGKLELETVDFDLRRTLEDVAELLAERAHARNLEIAVDFADDVETAVRGDPGRLRQILINLVGNAIKFTERGEVVARVRGETLAVGARWLRFEVCDTGIGISPEFQQRIFGAFVQADGSTTRQYGGTGLGLTIASQLVAMMEGEIGVESEVGVGSTFWFRVPLALRPRGVEELKPVRRDLEDLRVMIVDDNATNRELLHQQVQSWGMRDEQAENAPSALHALGAAAVRGEAFDLVLLDMMMPAMDGIELARRIKASPTLASARLVLLTSMGLRGDATEARHAGIDGYLTKPIRQSELYDCLATIMGRERGERSLVTRHTVQTGPCSFQGRILLVEDNGVNQEVVQSLLESLGCVVDAVGDGEQAVERAAGGGYDAILMDCHMPRMDGFEATAAIRRQEQAGARIPIIALTANAMAGDRERCLAAGMDDYLSKPVRHGEIDAVLKRWLDGARSRHEPAAADAAAGEGTPAPVVAAALEQVFQGVPQAQIPLLLERMVARFMQETPQLIERAGRSMDSSDLAGVYQAAHSLKSSSAFVGALRLSEICRALEELSRSKDLAAATAKLREVRAEYARVEDALRGMT